MWKQVISFLRGRGIKTSDFKDEQRITLEQQSQKESKNKDSVRHPRRKAKKLLQNYGIKDIHSQDDINWLFWTLAFRRKPINRNIANAVRILICDNRLMNSFNRKLELYNGFMESINSDSQIISGEEQLKEENAKLRKSLAKEIKDKNIIKQKLEHEEGMGRRFAKKFINQLKAPDSKFHQIYDFTRAEDIEEFLSWYKLLKRQVAKRTIKGIIKNHLTEEDSQVLFVNMVEAHNAQFLQDSEGEGI